MCAPSPPPAPDYTGAAQATAAGNLDAARTAAAANKVNQVTPYGSLTYSIDGKDSFGNDRYTATQSLAPAQQQLLDSTNQLNQGLMSTANTGLGYANNVLSKPGVDMSQQIPLQSVNALNPTGPVDLSSLPSTGINPGQSYTDAMMSRLQPQIDRENQQSDAQLANQGIMQGSQAYNTAKTLLGQQHNDLLNSAVVQGMNTGLAANNQAFGQQQTNNTIQFGQNQAANAQTLNQNQQALQGNQQNFQQQAYNQMQPINVINALRTGSQVQNPQFANIPQQANTLGPDYMGAAQGQNQYNLGLYNSQVGQNNALQGGLFQLGSAYAGSPAGAAAIASMF